MSDSIVAVLKNFLMKKKILKRILKIQQHEIKTYQTHINASWCGNSSMEKMVHHQQPIPRTNPNNRYGRREREKKRIKIHVTKSKMNFYCTFLLIFSFFMGSLFPVKIRKEKSVSMNAKRRNRMKKTHSM